MANRPADFAIVNISCSYFALIANMIVWMMQEEESYNRDEDMTDEMIG